MSEDRFEVDEYGLADPVMVEEQSRRLVRFARQAEAIVSYLLARKVVILVEESDARARLEARLIRCLKNGVFTDGWAGERLLGVLVHCDAVDEVYANLSDAHRALEHRT